MSSDPSADFTISLKDETSGAASAAANSLVSLRKTIDDDLKALRAMQRAMRNLKAATGVGSKAFKVLRDQISAQKAIIGSAQSKYVLMGGTFEAASGSAQKLAKELPRVDQGAAGLAKLSDSSAGLASALQGVGAAASKAGGPIGSLGGLLSRLGAFLANPAGAALALAAGLVAVAAAAVTSTAALLRFGVAQSGVRRSEALQIEGLNTLRQQYGRTTASVGAMQAAIDRASDSTNVGRGALAGYARQLSRAGLRGESLASAVEAMGIAAMVQGDRGARRFRAMAILARRTGQSVDDLAESYRRRLGPIARRQMLSLDNQALRLRRSLDRIFSGLRIEVFLGAIERVTSLFSQTTASGRALKGIVERMFQPLINATEVLGPIMRAFFQGMILSMLVIEGGLLRLEIAYLRAFGSPALLSNIDTMNVAFWVGVAAMSLMAAAVVTVAAGFALAAAGVAAFATWLVGLPALLVGAAVGVGVAIGAALDFVRQLDMGAMATNLINGLVQGITSGTARVAAAVRGIASSASSAFRSALGIESPSRVFAQYGANISAGVVEGVGAGEPAVSAAIGSLVDVPEGGALGGGGVSISIGDITISAGETSNPRELALAFRDELSSVLAGLTLEGGAA